MIFKLSFFKNFNLNFIVWIYLLVLFISVALTAVSLAFTIFDQGLLDREFCFNSQCIESFIEVTNGSFTFIYWCGAVSSAVFALISVTLLISNYISNTRTQNISNNIAQFKHFSDYVEALTAKYDQVSTGSISTLDWYHVLYLSPVDGDFDISESYLSTIVALDELIANSNNDFVAGGKYRFREHQRKLAELVSQMGIEVHMGPRTAFFEAERQLISLINDVNSMFIPGKLAVRQIRGAEFK